MSFLVVPDIKFDEKSVNNFNSVLNRYYTELGKSVDEVMKKGVKLMATALSVETPPFVDKSATNSLQAKNRGESAVKQDLTRAMTPFSAGWSEAFKSKSLRKYVKNKDYIKFNEAIQKMPNMSKWKAKPFNEEWHTLMRRGGNQGRYRIDGLQHIVTFDKAEWDNYLKRLQAKVGYLKAGWLKTAVAFGGDNVAWIGRHFSYCKGGYSVDFTADKKQIIFWNATPTIKLYSSRYNYTIDETSKKMFKDIEIQLAYNARKAQGL